MSKTVERAYRAIRTQILEGVLVPGARLKEEELAASIGVSRTPIREALRRLNAEQLVSFSPNHGAHVAAWSHEDMAEIFALRGILESHAAERAASRITEAELARLTELQAEIEQGAAAIPPDLGRISHANVEFHRVLVHAARSERLIIMVSWLIEMPVVLNTFSRFQPADMNRSLSQHRELIEALRSRDPVWARSVMQSHISAGRNAYARSPDGPIQAKLVIPQLIRK